MDITYVPIYIIFIPIITALLIYIVHHKWFSSLILLAQGGLTLLTILYFRAHSGFVKPHILQLGGWHPTIGISLKNDTLSISFIFLTLFIWWMVIVYCWNKRREDFKFLFFLMFLEGVFLGLLQTNDLFNLFVFIEITTIISTILMVYKKDGYSVRAGFYYLLFNSVGMLFYLLGLALLYRLTGSLNMDYTAEQMDQIRGLDTLQLAYIFMIVAIGVKSAFFPVYNWLPKAHGAAPASISALLSGLLIKSGLYAYIRLNQMFQITGFYDLFFIIGCLTALSGVIFALSQKDIKQVLAFHTISQVGIILMGISAMDGKAYYGGVLHVFNHAMFKSLLFMGAGHIINRYGTRRITEIRGVFKNFPMLSIFMIIGMLSITGAPLFNGFVSKTIIKYGLQGNSVKEMLLFIINLGTATSFIKLSQMFFGSFKLEKPKDYHSHVAMFFLALMCIVLGNYYIPIIKGFMGVDLSFVKVFKLDKWINYTLTLALATAIYKLIIARDFNFLKRIRHTQISFQTTIVMLIGLVMTMILWGKAFV